MNRAIQRVFHDVFFRQLCHCVRCIFCYEDAQSNPCFEFRPLITGNRAMNISRIAHLYLYYLWTRCSRITAMLGTVSVHAPLQHIQGHAIHA